MITKQVSCAVLYSQSLTIVLMCMCCWYFTVNFISIRGCIDIDCFSSPRTSLSLKKKCIVDMGTVSFHCQQHRCLGKVHPLTVMTIKRRVQSTCLPSMPIHVLTSGLYDISHVFLANPFTFWTVICVTFHIALEWTARCSAVWTDHLQIAYSRAKPKMYLNWEHTKMTYFVISMSPFILLITLCAVQSYPCCLVTLVWL